MTSKSSGRWSKLTRLRLAEESWTPATAGLPLAVIYRITDEGLRAWSEPQVDKR